MVTDFLLAKPWIFSPVYKRQQTDPIKLLLKICRERKRLSFLNVYAIIVLVRKLDLSVSILLRCIYPYKLYITKHKKKCFDSMNKTNVFIHQCFTLLAVLCKVAGTIFSLFYAGKLRIKALHEYR